MERGVMSRARCFLPPSKARAEMETLMMPRPRRYGR